MLLMLSISLTGCDTNYHQVIKMSGIHYITCDGVEKSIGENFIVTIGENIVIQYTPVPYVADDARGLIVSKRCKIE